MFQLEMTIKITKRTKRLTNSTMPALALEHLLVSGITDCRCRAHLGTDCKLSIVIDFLAHLLHMTLPCAQHIALPPNPRISGVKCRHSTMSFA